MIDRLAHLVFIEGIAIVCCLALLVAATFFNVHNYLVLRRLQDVPGNEGAHDERLAFRETIKQTPTVRYDSDDLPDAGELEWTGPVTPYVPADRSDTGDPHDHRVWG